MNSKPAILRASLLLMLAFASFLYARAERVDVWDGVTVTEPEGADLNGSTYNTYLIRTGAELKWVQQHPALWGKTFRQMGDIDLGGHPLGMIGYGVVTGTNKPFTGVYEGNGFVIKNLALDFDDQYNEQISFGLFGFVQGGKIRNLILDNVTMTSSKRQPTPYDIKVGCLAGAVGQNKSQETRIENIIVRNSRLSDGGNADPNIQSLLCGGLIGDITNAFGTYANMVTSYGKIFISNVYVECDFDFPAFTRKVTINQTVQFNVGGIVGRLRKPNPTILPTNTFYSGKVNAPRATIAPVWGMARSASNNESLTEAIQGFVGAVVNDNGNIFVLDGASTTIGNATYQNDASRFYSAFSIYDAKEGRWVDFTDTEPAHNNELFYYNSRALAEQKGIANPAKYFTVAEANSATLYRPLQGVAHGTYVAPANVKAAIDAAFSPYVESHAANSLIAWDFSQEELCFLERPGFELERTGFKTFDVTLARAADPARYRIDWEADFCDGSPLKAVSTYFDASGHTTYTMTENPDIYHTLRAKLVYADGTAMPVASMRVIDFPDPVINLQRDPADELKFNAWIDSEWPEAKYKFKWYIADVYGNINSDLLQITGGDGACADSYTFAASSQLPPRVKVVLCDALGNELWNAQGTSYIQYDIPITSVQEDEIYSYAFRVEQISAGRRKYVVASLYDDEGNIVAGGYPAINTPGVTFRWEVNPDPSNVRGWTQIEENNPLSSFVSLYTSEMYYRVTWFYNLRPFGSQIYGARKVIFLYSKPDTDYGRAKKYTTFDGKDHWTEEGADQEAEYPDGDDNNDGSDPYHAVKTIEQAYRLCRETFSMDENMIVVMGYFHGPTKIFDIASTHLYNRPATITGKCGSTIDDGCMVLYGKDGGNFYIEPATLGASTRFIDITLRGEEKDNVAHLPNSSGYNYLYLYAAYHDLCIDTNVKFKGYEEKKDQSDNGLMPNKKTIQVHIVGGVHNSTDWRPVFPDDNAIMGITSLTFKSGAYARIISAGRNNKVNNESKNLLGAPSIPYRVNVLIDIQEPNRDQCASDIPYDIGLLVGGQTDGTCFCESNIELRAGTIGRYISGNISYGRAISGGPSDSFFGSTTFTLKGGVVDELYGGSLGRTASSSNVKYCEAYFYGRSIINVAGATINSTLYAAGAGGISGVGDDVYHTDDKYIPYLGTDSDGNITLEYGDYDAAKDAVADFQFYDGSLLNFKDTYCEINVTSGVIHGDIFGGGCGYSLVMAPEKAPVLAGTLFGSSCINISQDPYQTTLITGNIYGGGAGDTHYYASAKAAYDDADPESESAPALLERAEAFKRVARLFGDTQINISGGTITGDVFAGAMGKEDFPDMASVHGNTWVQIRGDAKVLGNIFGGSDFAAISKRGKPLEHGKIDWGGNTMVHIMEEPVIGNNIFGGSKGKAGTDYAPRIEGDAWVVVTSGSFIDTPFQDDGATMRTFNIYGGGYNKCVVEGDTHVTLYQSLLKDTKSIGADFMSYWRDLTHRRFCVYGGGYGAETDVLGTANVDIDVETYDVLIHPDDGINFYAGKQFFDISGGGFSGNVNATNVTLQGNSLVRKLIGGGFFGSVRQTAKTSILSGIVQSVFGGCMMGYVHDRVEMQIGTRSPGFDVPENATLWVLENVYGGNDVQGIIGAQLSASADPALAATDPYNPAVLYQTDINPAHHRGAYINIYGGRIMGSVYGAGNGHYTGYYVPGWGKYLEGPARFYRNVPSRSDINTPERVYKTRPTVGRVSLNIQGNSPTDYVQIDSMVFGGGRDCTIGQWIPELMAEDPRRLNLERGGELNMNFGSYVNVGKSVYMGSQGRTLATQTKLPQRDDIAAILNNIMTMPQGVELNDQLELIGEAAYDHWYYDSDAETYRLGHAPRGKMYRNPAETERVGQNPQDAGNCYFFTGEHTFYAIMKFIEMASKINLTFYDDPWDADGELRKMPDNPDDCIAGPAGVRYDAQEVHMGSFFLGGERGFMTYQPDDPNEGYAYDILLPPGVTIREKAVGGCENSWLTYYPYKAGTNYTEIDDSQGPMYDIKGGIGVESIFSDSPDDAYPKVDPATLEAIIVPGETNTTHALRLSVVANFTPMLGEDAVDPVTYAVDNHKRYGGLIYGGCYQSGFINGDVVLNIGANLLGSNDYFSPDSVAAFDEYSSLKYNVGRVFGAGYGRDTEVQGNTYVYLLNEFKGLNVFGGGMEGRVTGTTSVSYVGAPQKSYVYGAIYGGSLMSDVGYQTPDAEKDQDKVFGSSVYLYSGNVNKVYGGSCMGNVYGGSHVYVCNNSETKTEHMDWDNIQFADWGHARIVAGSVYGGNDISGDIISAARQPLTAFVEVNDMTESVFGNGETHPGMPDGDNYHGFPLIGNLYGGSNANYGEHNTAAGLYTSGSIEIATGVNTRTRQIDLAGMHIPNVERAKINILGGSVINLFGGGCKSTVTERTEMLVQHTDTVVRAGFGSQEQALRARNVLGLRNMEQYTEVLRANEPDAVVLSRQIFRMYGGNDNADMAIQPRMDLRRGVLGSVYSGGNVGRMTYFNPDHDPDDADCYNQCPGLQLTINSPDIRIDNVYGGGRIGDVTPSNPDGSLAVFTHTSDYGATVNIRNGIIEHVYGGNDVAGQVYNGTRVNLYGAISGDVYGAGNGNYMYKYDRTGAYDAITEAYTAQGKRYFILPRKDRVVATGAYDYGGDNPSDGQVILAINSYRPNVDRSSLNIEGSATSQVWVKGNAFCGGNSATVSPKNIGGGIRQNDIRFNIGSYVTLNGVYMGANGRDLVNGQRIYDLEQINGLDFTEPNTLEAGDVADDDAIVTDKTLYPRLLDLYMRAVEVTNLPSDFQFPTDLTEAYIGDFFIGGNHGSMMTDQLISLTFPEELVIYGQIVGGCNQATISYKDVPHVGGLTMPLASGQDKLHLVVKSKFKPMRLEYPVQSMDPPIVLHDNLVDTLGVSLYEEQPDGTFAIPAAKAGWKKLYPNGQCNIYGGCYNSGKTVGNIQIDLYSDMLDYAAAPAGTPWICGRVNRQAVINSIDKHSWRAFQIIGGGYGADTEVEGDITVRMLPGKATDTYDPAKSVKHPSTGGIFGGAQGGRVVGNTRVEIRDGFVLSNVYGASESARMYGSSNVTIGYPDYYVATARGEYALRRADNLSIIGNNGTKNHDNSDIIKRAIKVLPGDIVAKNVYDAIAGVADKTTVFDHAQFRPGDIATETGRKPVKWDDIEIFIGEPFSMTHKDAPFYGHGNVYGGGFISNRSNVTLSGQNTVLEYNSRYNRGPETIGYGGNASVLAWDNPENALRTGDVGEDEKASDGSAIMDHVTIGTGRYKHVTLKEGQDKMGLYQYQTGNFVHQPMGKASAKDVADNNYYQFEGDGGIYGGGRTVYVKGFRSIDLGYYGYASFAPQEPKLLNTFQRSDLLTIRDCCLMLQGASDFATNKVDNTLYAINRVGEMQMISSIPQDQDLIYDGEDEEFYGNLRHTTKRQRNYVGLFHNIHYLGAFVSNVGFNSGYHNKNGQLVSASGSYLQAKHDNIANYYSSRDTYADEFRKRNVGTAANMVGINNGYSLRIQGTYTESDGETDVIDKYFYGPVFGVTEVKLLTLAKGEGGGYIYALNHHYDPDYDEQSVKDIYGGAGQDFLYTTGNFVFPGAKFMVKPDASEDYNYIIDDCMPIGSGYDQHKHAYDAAHASRAIDGFDVNKYGAGLYGDEAHYWYVNGQIFTFNLNLTGYTKDTKVNPISFYLDNSDDLVYLPNLTNDHTLSVESIVWSRHPEKPTYDCDLADLLKDYHLYLTVGRDPELGETDKPATAAGCYIVELARDDFDKAVGAAAGAVDPNNTATQTPYDPRFANSTAFSTDNENLAAVGIRLVDAVNNRLSDKPASEGHEYWINHLADPHNVQIVLKSKHSSDDSKDNTYILNLTISYLLGPRINGTPVIENCALPGEYIYANSDNVDIDMDDTNMAITDRSWYLCPIDGNGNVLAPEKHNEYKIDGTDLAVRIPAYYYQNKWRVKYGVKANGEVFYTDVNPADEHPWLQIHNYHRMRPFDGTTVHDLKLVPGARIYIEDDADLLYFFQYMKERQYRGGYSPVITPDGREMHPQYAEGLDFYLQDNVNVPTSEQFNPEGMITFKGNFHGNGYHFNIHELTSIPYENAGYIYNLGVVSESTDENTCVFNKNENGHLVNCYYFNTHELGYLAKDGDVENCYQNTSSTPEFVADLDLLQISSYAFRYGSVAYNLNGFYLKKRNLLLRYGAQNTRESLIAKDMESRDNPDYQIEYIERMFNNRDYQYAFSTTANRGEQFTQALRTNAIPNYFDMMGYHEKGEQSTHHNMAHTPDDLRDMHCEHDVNHPRFDLDDYMFFGQEISAAADAMDVLDVLPTQFTPDTRVYRISGFYGSKADRGCFVNRKPYIGTSLVTAVDFTGIRDKDPDLISVVNTLREDPSWNGWVMGKSEGIGLYDIYYPPTIDVSLTQSDDLSSTEIVLGDNVTRNLLIYGHDIPLYNQFHYQDAGLPATDHDRAQYDDTGIKAHHIQVTETEGATTYKVHGGFLNLVDKERFNAPVAFDYDELWYNRQPLGFADGVEDKDAWEGLYLPFTVKTVYAGSTSSNYRRDHGVISHFYDDSQTLHEYWLRRLVSVNPATSEATYESPTEDNQQAGEDYTATYAFTNTYFMDVYGDYDYEPDLDLTHHNAYTAEHSFAGYRHITAAVPYIVTYPGERYREFDMSGNFYANTVPGEVVSYPQTICYMAEPNGAISVTDDLNAIVYESNGYKFGGTFNLLTTPTDFYYVLDEDNSASDFMPVSAGTTIYPFRTYMISPSGLAPAPIKIKGPGADAFFPGDDDDDDDDDNGGDDPDDLIIRTEGSTLIVISPRPCQLPLYNMQGQLARRLPILAGENRYSDISPGIYLLSRTKFRLTP